jgi:large subunit ribosomal protein L2
MALKSFRPLTASLRFTTLNRPDGISKKRPERSLVESKSKTGGRNVYGRITSRRRGGGHKKLYRIIDFKRAKLDMLAKVQAIEYDPNRTALLALLAYTDGTKAYILAPAGLKAGDTVYSAMKTDTNDYHPGNSFPLAVIPPATKLHAVELLPGKGAQIARSAGTSAELVTVENGFAQLRLSSGETRLVNAKCRATIGEVSNADHGKRSLGKAGRNRWLGKRPRVRGVAMNPVDHPHGGGEGRTSGGRHPVTPWGKPTKGSRTRTNKATDKFIIRSRHARKAR